MTRGDRLLIVALAIACVLTWPLAASAGGAAQQLTISGPAGESKISLEDAQELRVQGRTGDLVVVVQSGSVRVTEAECPDRVCVKTGSVAAAGSVIACVPNGVVLRIEGGGDEFDARIR